jgi:hypothetical protein
METRDITYSFACVCNTKYIENTIVCLTSLFEHNDVPVDLYMVNSEKTKAFDRFKNVRVHYVYYAIDRRLYTFTIYRECLEEIVFKLQILDTSSSDYTVLFDTDTLFVDSIEDALIEYPTTLNIVKPKFFEGVNAGFIIYKKNPKKLFDELMKDIHNDVRYILLEEEFLYKHFKDDITFLDSRFNYSEWMSDTTSKPAMIHYIGRFKPFKMFDRLIPDLFATKYFNYYYDFVDKHPDIVSDKFKQTLAKTKRFAKLINKLKERD